MPNLLAKTGVLLATLLLTQAWGADSDAAKKDMSDLQGEWSMVSASGSGQTMSGANLKNSKRVCKGNETTVIVGGQLLMKATFTLDPSTTPKRIDYQVIGGPNSGKSQEGIYELSGDTVKFCFAAPGKERPSDFSTSAGDGRTSSVWKRENK